jgi:hypothetical protein
MAIFTQTAQQIFASTDANGNARRVAEEDVGVWGTELERAVSLFISSGGLIYSSLASLNSDLAHGANSMAWVIGDPVAANNGVYAKVGASGVGSWSYKAGLPYSFIIATDAGAGTPNAIEASTFVPVSPSALIWMNVADTNTGSPVTVSFNGGTALTVKTNTGNNVAAGGLASGMVVLGIVSGSTFRLLSDQVSSAIVAAAEAAQAAAESAAASINIRNVSTRTALKALNTASTTVAFLGEAGREGIFRWLAGNYSTQITADNLEGMFIKADGIAASAGAWVRQDGWHVSGINPEWFGAVSGPATSAFTTDSADALIASYTMAALIGANVTIPSGFYRSSKRLDFPSGIIYEGLGTNEGWEIPLFDLNAATTHRGVTICFTGTGTRNINIDYMSSMRQSSAYRVNPNRIYNNANDNYLEATGLNNNDASLPSATNVVTRATLKPVSAAVTLGADGLSGKTILRNIRFVVACDDGVNGPLAGYLAANANAYVPWAEWDFGIINYTPYTTLIEDCQFVGFWSMKAALQTPMRFGNTQSGGRGEMCIWQRNWFQGGVAIRNGDFSPVIAKTANSFDIEWGPGHRLVVGGTIYVDSVAFPITGLSQANTGNGVITITTSASTANIVVSGDDRSVAHMTNNNGTTQTVFRDNNIRDFWHPSLVERPSTVFGSQASKYSAAVELVGYPIRGITFENNTIYTQEPFFILQEGARDIAWIKGTYEEKSYRSTLSGSLNPGGAIQGLAIVGPMSTALANWPMLLRGDNMLLGYPWSGRLNIAPVTLTGSGRRYSTFADCNNGFRFEWKGRGSGDEDIIYDARLPEIYRISSGSINAYTKHFTIDTESSASIDDLNNIVPGQLGLEQITFSTTSSTRDVVLKHMTGGDYQIYCKSGADTTLPSPVAPVIFVLLNKIWYQL